MIPNTITFSDIKIIGERTCEHCGAKVKIIERKGRTISDCLNCENLRMKDEFSVYAESLKDRKYEIFFERYSLVPDDLLKCSFDNYIPQNQSQEIAKQKCVNYVKEFDHLKHLNKILMQGSYGLGKSHLSFSIASELKSRKKKVIFITMPNLLDLIRDSYNSKDSNEMDILETCKNVDLLIMDDLGAEYIKDDKNSWAADKIFTIINSRLDKPTIYTTNLSSSELKEKYGYHGGRIVSRIMQGTDFIKIEGKDHRLKGW